MVTRWHTLIDRWPRWTVRCRFDPHDVWIGAHWTGSPVEGFTVYVCVLPMLVVRFMRPAYGDRTKRHEEAARREIANAQP